jgi:hypothetical protein
MIHTTSPTQLAIQYAIDTPTATQEELQALFAIRPCDAAYAYRRGVESRRTDWPIKPQGKGKRPLNNKPALAAARAWAIANRCNSEKPIYEKFNITSMQARGISKETTAAIRDHDPQAEKRKAAKEYIAANRKIATSQIASKFGVSADYVKRQRSLLLAAERKESRIIEASKSRRKVNRLHAVMCDGSTIKPTMVKDWKCWVGRFTKVVV